MFDKILELVKDHFEDNPEIGPKLTDDQKNAVAIEVATHLTTGLTNHEVLPGGTGGILSMLENAGSTNNPLTNAIESGLINSLTCRFGLSPSITGAIAGALPGLLEKFALKVKDPDDENITTKDITKPISDKTIPAV
jgi:hypothetical protein